MVVHLYRRAPEEWVVFVAGDFERRTVELQFERALRAAEALAERQGLPLRVHGEDAQPIERPPASNAH
jgi:hypothetical protein